MFRIVYDYVNTSDFCVIMVPLLEVSKYSPRLTYIEFKCTNCDSRGSAWSGKSYKMLTSNITRKQGEPNLNDKILLENCMTWCDNYEWFIYFFIRIDTYW